MALESGTYIQDLVISNPDGAVDPKSGGDNHLRLIKTVAKNTFPNAIRPLYFEGSKTAQTGTVNVVAADASKVFPCNAAGGVVTVNLPASAGIYDGFFIWVVKTDSSANLVTVDGNGSDPISGSLTFSLAHQYQALFLIWCSNVSGWVALRSDTISAVDATLTFVANVLGRAALTGAIAASAGSNATTQVSEITATIGDGVNAITTGVKGYLPVYDAGTITGWTIIGDASGSCVIDVWKASGAVPVNANSIAGSEKPTLTAQQLNSDNSLSTWTTAFVSGDVFGFEVESATTVKQVTVTIRFTKNG